MTGKDLTNYVAIIKVKYNMQTDITIGASLKTTDWLCHSELGEKNLLKLFLNLEL